MKVKIGDKVYDSSEEPILLILGTFDKYNIGHMEPEATRYLSYPESMSADKARQILINSCNIEPKIVVVTEPSEPVPPPCTDVSESSVSGE